VAARFLDAAARAGFKHAIETIENASAVEVVVAVRRRSAAYHHANAIVGAVVAFAALAAMLFASSPFGLNSILFDPFAVGVIAAALVELTPQVKRALTRRVSRTAHVLRAARATFVERGIHATTGRSGVLVYVSWLERTIALVPDRGLAASWPAAAIDAAERALTDAMARGGAEVARVLEALAPELARAMPHRDDDVNELPDAIDSDLDGAAR